MIAFLLSLFRRRPSVWVVAFQNDDYQRCEYEYRDQSTAETFAHFARAVHWKYVRVYERKA